MGGLVAADIALVFRHRIVGVINFDVPFLGMHPGIIKAGLGSLFSPAPAPIDVIPEEPAGKKPSRIGTLFNSKPSDPNFNPSFHNDVQLPVRKGWENTMHWLNKHYSNGLREATKGLVKSHFEFGSAMADYKSLKNRYARIRALEEDDEKTRKAANPGIASPPRTRFVNYYTVSTGRPKKPKSPKSSKSPTPSSSRPPSRGPQPSETDVTLISARPQPVRAGVSSQTSMEPLHLSVEVQEHRGGELVPITPQEPPSATSPVNTFSREGSTRTDSTPNFPEIPPIPQEPPFVDLMQFTDKQQRKAAEKEHDKALKEYQKAVKARNKAIKEKTKAEEKWEKQQAKEQEKQQEMQQEEKRELSHAEKEELRLQQERDRMERERQRMEGGPPKEQKESNSTKSSIEIPHPDDHSHPSKDMHTGYEMSPEEAPEIQALDEDLGAVTLGDRSHPAQSSNHPYSNYGFSHSAIMNQATPDDQSSTHGSMYTMTSTDSLASQVSSVSSGADDDEQPDNDKKPKKKKKKLRKFCMLPPKDSEGNKDPTWVRVFMQDIDEVTAHTSLFFMNETYERLVGDVGARIEEWIREADSVRVVREMAEM